MDESNLIVYGPQVGFPEKALDEMSLDEYIIAALKERSNDTVLVDAVTEDTLKVDEFVQKSHQLAVELQALGCEKGTIVGIISENRAEFPIVILGTLLAGATLTPYNPNYSSHEFQPVFNITKPAVIFCSGATQSRVEQVVPASTTVIIFDQDPTLLNTAPNLLKFSDLVQTAKAFLINAVKNRPDETAIVLYSSGTTGLPKGVMLTHGNFTFLMKLQKAERITKRSGSMIPITSFMCHISGLEILLTALIRDEIGILIPKLDKELFLSMIQKYKIDHAFVMPALLLFLVKDPAVDEYDLSSMEYLTFGGAPVKEETEHALKKKFNLRYLQQVYGMTETTLYSTRTDSRNQKRGTCGSPIPGTQMKIVDTKTGKILGKNEIGEIYIKGPHVMKGYFNNEKATAENLDGDGWLCSGDVAYYDDDGDFFIVDRAKELIKCEGSQVSPAELESLLLTHPSVADAAVIGIPDDNKIELPRAFVVKKSGTKVTADEIVQYLNGMVQVPSKRLEGGVEFIPEIPRNLSGKILRRILKERWYERRQ